MEANEISISSSGKTSRTGTLERPQEFETERKKKMSVARSFAGIWKQLVEKEKAKCEGGKTDSMEFKPTSPTKSRSCKRSRSVGAKSWRTLVKLDDGKNVTGQKSSVGRFLSKSQTMVGINYGNLSEAFASADNQEIRIRVPCHFEKFAGEKEKETGDYANAENDETDSNDSSSEAADQTEGEEEGEATENLEEDYCFLNSDEKEAQDEVEPLGWHKALPRRRRSKSNADIIVTASEADTSKCNSLPVDRKAAANKSWPDKERKGKNFSMIWSDQPRFQGLWCEQKHVVESGIVDSMDENERKLHEVLFEVIATEENYLRSLDIVFNYFKSALEATTGDRSAVRSTQKSNLEVSLETETTIMQKYEFEILFFNIGTIREYSEKFLKLFELNQGDKLLIHNYLDSFTEYVDSVLRRAIIKYCSNLSHQREVLKTLLNKNKEFTHKIKELESDSRLMDKTFKSFLMVPMTRICQLPLLIERIVKVSEKPTDDFSVAVHDSAMRAYAAVQDVASQCNQETRKLEEMAEKQIILLNIERTLKVPLNIKFSLISSSRTLLCECNATLIIQSSGLFKNNVEIKLHFKLFHDILLICKPVQDKFAVLDIADVRAGSVYLSDLSESIDNQNMDRCKFLSHGQKQKQPISMVLFRTKVGDYLESGSLRVPHISDGPIDPPSMGPVCFQDYEQIYIIQPAEKREHFIKNMRACIANRRSSASHTIPPTLSQMGLGTKRLQRNRMLSSTEDKSLSMSELHEIDSSQEKPNFVNVAKNSAFHPLSPRQTSKSFRYAK